ncbi:MAG: hypothetical protein RSE25_04895 [Bacteroidales bacterium]
MVNGRQFTTYINDVVAPYQTNIRKTDGFRPLPLKRPYDMTYAAIQRDTRIGIMANHIALDAKAKPRGTKGFTALEGTIPHIGANRTMGKEDYLMAAKVLESTSNSQPIQQSAQMMLYDMLGGNGNSFFPNSPQMGMYAEHGNRISYMRDQGVSNGYYEITEANNDGSFTGIKFNYNIPTINRTTLSGTKRWWTDADRKIEGADSTPLEDLRNELFEKARKKNLRKEMMLIEVEYNTFFSFLRHSKVRASVASYLYPTIADKTIRTDMIAGWNETRMKQIVEEILGITFIVSDTIVAIEKFNKTKGILEDVSLDSFTPDTFVLRPKGDIGEIHSTSHIMLGGNTSDSMQALSEGGRILTTYTLNLRENIQIWDTEETTLMVLTAGKSMFYLNVK